MATVLVPNATDNFAAALQWQRTRIDERLAVLLPAGGDPVAAAIRSGVMAPGKRLRPLLMVLAAEDLGQSDEAVLDLGCAVEMVHAASLFLDDMPCMDDARLRRGRPTLHVEFGEDVAMLAAVALLSHALRLVAGLAGVPAETRTQMVCQLADAVGTAGLVCGQYHDLHGGRQTRPADAIALTNQLKTGALFSAAMGMAGATLVTTAEQREAFQVFACQLGLAFQLLDDLDDGKGLGKDAGKDGDKSTLVSLLGRDHAQRQLQSHLRQAREALAQADCAEGALAGLLDIVFRPR